MTDHDNLRLQTQETYDAMPQEAKAFLDRWRLSVEMSGRCGPTGDAVAIYGEFVQDFAVVIAASQASMKPQEEKAVGEYAKGSGV